MRVLRFVPPDEPPLREPLLRELLLRDRLPADELRLRERLLDARDLLPELRLLLELDEPDDFDPLRPDDFDPLREDPERERLFDPEALLRPERLDPPLERRAPEVPCDCC